MSGARLPSVRIPAAIIAGQAVDEEDAGAVVVELPSSNRFGIAWPAEPNPPMAAPAERPAAVSLSSSDGETDISEEENHAREELPSRMESGEDSEFVTPTNRLNSDRDPLENAGQTPAVPRISRALSMPLPSQLGPFQHPRRISTSSESSFIMAEPPQEPTYLEELSLELADSVQMVIQTLLQLSPPQVLDPAKEQFSACSLSIPTPSVSAMFTSMKNLNFMSANMSTFSLDPNSASQTVNRGRTKSEGGYNCVDFDVGEMLQSVGDALSGVAAQAGVDLVLFHDDLGMRHVAVRGDESGLSYTLSHVLRQVISVAKRGDSIEIGLFIDNAKGPYRSPSPGTAPRSGSPHFGVEGPLRCSFHIAHRFGTSETNTTAEGANAESPREAEAPSPPSRNQPSFKTLVLRRLLQHVDAQLDVDIQTKGAFVGRCCTLAVTLDRGSPSVIDPAVNLTPEDAAYLGYPADIHIAQEPTLEQLTQFAESLRGRKVTLIAHSKGSFAQHLTSYLTAWGLDVSHESTEPGGDGSAESGDGSGDSQARGGVPATASPEQSTSAAPGNGTQEVAEPFILIDDDVSALRARLQKIRAEQAYPLNLHTRKRPSLATNHRPRSSPQVARVMGFTAQSTQVTPQVVIVHYTSLANFKLVKDAVQSIIVPGNSWTRLPEVIVVPKPAGPRRILTALHTAVTKPVVDPFFAPIATSPVSPSFHPMSPLFAIPPTQRSPGGRSLRTGSDRSTRSPKEGLESVSMAPSSPLGMSDNIEYFSDAASKLGTSPASGLVIQSPDGQPAGIFFHPKGKGKNSGERGQVEHPGGRPRGSSYRRSSDTDDPRKGLSSPHTETHRRSPRPPILPEAASVEPIADTSSPTTGTRPKTRQPSITEETVLETEAIATSPSEQAPPPAAPKLPRRTSQDPRHSPPLSPQARTSSPAVTRRPSKRPTAESTASAPAAIPKKGTRGTENNIVPPISVLIVDDNPINQTILSTFMKKKKIKYDVAKNGEEAVQKWRSGGFHLILMDIQMPVMDGIQATKEIRRIEKSNGVGGFPSTPQSEGQQTPSEASTSDTRSASTPSYRSSVIIVALTASSLQSDRVAALAAGCNDFLTKPVSLHWLNNKIIEWGSIKALQMWADIRPEVVRSITTGQAAQARNVASRLHVPEGRSTPLAPRSRSPSQARKIIPPDAARAAAESLSKAVALERTPSMSDDAPKTVPPPSASTHAEAAMSPLPDSAAAVTASAGPAEAPSETPPAIQGTPTDADVASPPAEDSSNTAPSDSSPPEATSDVAAAPPSVVDVEPERESAVSVADEAEAGDANDPPQPPGPQ
ncbi:hypothetical protein GY45DRAFT_476735 [Cubamyces sp. BRFM 1775]|nr:hypothetical protein GY45DRAFT_476735 [Cubamyces sp. BRFM 1775]